MVEITVAARKEAELAGLLKAMRSVVISFSGGVDSSYLLKVAHDTLGANAIAATGLSQTYAPEEMHEAKVIASEIGAEYILVDTAELTDPRYADNTHQRCFFCKTELYGKMQAKAAELGFDTIVDGTNADDLGDFRPGLRAANQLNVVSPLAEAGMTKSDIRAAARAWGVPIWNKPAAACLSSRFQYGDPITVAKLRQVATAETGLRRLGFKGFRVRHHDETARLEIPLDQFPLVLEHQSAIVDAVRQAGYRYVTLDLEGFRSGSMNEVLNARVKSTGLRRSRTD
jgi:pyridinium-3,5-biscarboxylic acid mononucleotide sulfurtransferase